MVQRKSNHMNVLSHLIVAEEENSGILYKRPRKSNANLHGEVKNIKYCTRLWSQDVIRRSQCSYNSSGY